jgi:hypothetical protein
VSEAPPGGRADAPRPDRLGEPLAAPLSNAATPAPAASLGPPPRGAQDPGEASRPGRERETFEARPANGAADGSPGGSPNGAMPGGPSPAGCTAPQLRRFIKSRPYVPMHELRRRFGINGGEDDVSAIDLGGHRVFVGLPAREGSLLGELLRAGDIGYELSLDPRTPVVVGLYPMRPVGRA